MRSCFAMTEPPPGAGSDPAALMSTARKVAGGWLLLVAIAARGLLFAAHRSMA
jgi:hypothetical protein